MSRVSLTAAPSTASHVGWTQLYLGIGFTSLATLLLELALTRIFSVVFYYHFAFLAISVALFGLGAGGVFSYVVAARTKSLFRALGRLAVANALAVAGALWFVLSRSGDSGNWTLAAVYAVTALPFFLSGAVVSLAIAEAIQRVHRAYFFDLAGAASGCLLLIPFLNTFGGPNTVIAAAVLYCVAAAIWYHQAGGAASRAVAVTLALAFVGLMAINGKTHWIDVRVAKGQILPPERFTAWNSFSRVGVRRVTATPQSGAYWSIIIDGDAGTGIPAFDWDKGLTAEERAGLLLQGPGFPYVLRPGAKTLVIGSGGGYDVARALASGSRDVSAVEINPIIANKVMRQAMRDESHGIYFRPEVRLFVEDGRSFVRRTAEKYQVVQATLVDTWASTAAGAFALSENNLYTVEAFHDYLSHLTEDGLLAFTRWGFDPPRESLRLVSLAMEALARLGETRPALHVIAVREDSPKLQKWGALDTVLVSRTPLAAADLERARAWIASSGLDLLYLPGDAPRNPFNDLLTTADPLAFWSGYSYNVAPVSDDRPFFFYTVQPGDLWDFVTNASAASADHKINRAVPLLFALVGISIVATALVFVLPGIVLRVRLPKHEGIRTFLLYFACLGAGYVLIQVALIQKFVLLLGNPTYALTVIVFSMLVASGTGSFFSRRFVGGADTRLMRVLAGAAVVVAILAFAAGPLVRAAATWPLAAKMMLTAASIAPAAFLMGMPFPSGLHRLEARHAPAVKWAWSINAAASVLGSAGAVFLAIYFGLRATLLVGAMLYVAALVVIAATRRPL